MITTLDILRLLAQSPEPLTYQEIAEALNGSAENISKHLSQMKSKGRADNPDGKWVLSIAGQEIYEKMDKIAKAPIARVPTGGTRPRQAKIVDTVITPATAIVTEEKPPKMPAQTDYDKFMELGLLNRVEPNTLDAIVEYVFKGGDVYDLNWVWLALNQMQVRQDTRARWFHQWAAAIRKTVPPAIQQQLDSVTISSGGVVRPAPGLKWSVAGDVPIQDQDGEYTFGQAMQLIALSKGATPREAEKLSELIKVMEPFIKKDEGDVVEAAKVAGEYGVMSQIIPTLLAERGQPRDLQSPITVTDIITIFDRMIAMQAQTKPSVNGQPQDMMSQFMTFLTAMRTMKEMFAPTPTVTTGHDPMVQLSDGSISLEALLKIREQNWSQEKEKEELKVKRATGESFRGLLQTIAGAVASASGGKSGGSK